MLLEKEINCGLIEIERTLRVFPKLREGKPLSLRMKTHLTIQWTRGETATLLSRRPLNFS